MKNKILTTLAVIGFAVAAQAVPVTFNFLENGSNLALGNTSTFTEGGVSITAYASGRDILYAKNLGVGVETGLGLTSDPSGQNEITPGHFIQLGLPTTPITALSLLFVQSVTGGETALIYHSATLGVLGTLIGTLTGSGQSIDVSAFTTGYIGVTAGTGGGQNVLIESLTAELRTPDGGSTMLLMGSALTAIGLIRRKLTA